MTRFSIAPLAPHHDRRSFESASPLLDRYFREQVSQDVRRLVAACYVATLVDTGAVAGFYTLAAGSVVLTDLPEATISKLPRYPAVPVARLGRLAVHRRFAGQQLGAALLWDAAQRALASSVAAFALVVDAKDHHAAAFYRHHGFIPFNEKPLQLFLPLASLRSGV
ncbi:GNAT family N-acetyltransferase [Accumulibacter sp.]|uniref:GNAT family N-acetyltransferase n=1 Tax=Accumulibacter sp. TaxID=2053492 RepID=UPI0028786C66|nr:GNAT family N-acetyltransferase [Accumulibacter sp.]MDS4055359.1 GNAT family N-acetyltransferase [Accumulibacter sp.]